MSGTYTDQGIRVMSGPTKDPHQRQKILQPVAAGWDAAGGGGWDRLVGGGSAGCLATGGGRLLSAAPMTR